VEDYITIEMPDTTKTNDAHKHSHAQNRFAVIPTAEKLSARSDFSGCGVTIAFLDSGFYPHLDFVDRVVAFHDVTGDERSLEEIREPKGHHWHGTQTVVSCAGNGSLSDGIYRGIAHKAELVLVKVSAVGKINDESIAKGLEWVIENATRYEIRIVNISLGGDCDGPTSESRINQLIEDLVGLGVVVTVAAGNSSESRSMPPATAPSAITVGGYSDENQFESVGFDLYHSNFGTTADGIVKPEIVAPAMFVAAPILPGTVDYKTAESLSLLANSPDYLFRKNYLDNWRDAGLPEYILSTDVPTARQFVEDELSRRKIVATHYQHVDGTSFAAPITASVIAQMLEANPNLTPYTVKNILLSTAEKISGRPAIRQGFGVLNAELAVDLAKAEDHDLRPGVFGPPRVERNGIVFHFHDDAAENVFLVGDFNDWDEKCVPFSKNANGVWTAAIPCQSAGTYRYKFLVNGERWIEDPSHGFKEEDGFGGFHSLLIIAG
jgi:serine protease AprX